MKNIKIVALDFKGKMRQICLGWGSAPDPAGGAHSAPLDPIFNNNKVEKIWGFDLPLLVKLHEIWSLDSHGNQ